MQTLQKFMSDQQEILNQILETQYKNLDENLANISKQNLHNFESRANEILKAVSLRLENS